MGGRSDGKRDKGFAVACAFYFVNFLIVMRRAVCECISALNELVAPVSVVAVALRAVSGIEVFQKTGLPKRLVVVFVGHKNSCSLRF